MKIYLNKEYDFYNYMIEKYNIEKMNYKLFIIKGKNIKLDDTSDKFIHDFINIRQDRPLSKCDKTIIHILEDVLLKRRNIKINTIKNERNKNKILQ